MVHHPGYLEFRRTYGNEGELISTRCTPLAGGVHRPCDLVSIQVYVLNQSSPTMNTRDPKLIALLFNECINNRDVARLTDLMTEDHTFIDREGKTVHSKDAMVRGWGDFFELFPKYSNTFTHIKSQDDLVAILGFAYWSEKEPYDPAIWTATIENDQVREWRILADTESNRRRFDLL